MHKDKITRDKTISLFSIYIQNCYGSYIKKAPFTEPTCSPVIYILINIWYIVKLKVALPFLLVNTIIGLL